MKSDKISSKELFGALDQIYEEKGITREYLMDSLREALKIAIVKNISIIGNCLGTHDDIVDAGKLYERKGMKPVVEGIYKVYEGMQFLGKSFLGKNAPGKCVMTY